MPSHRFGVGGMSREGMMGYDPRATTIKQLDFDASDAAIHGGLDEARAHRRAQIVSAEHVRTPRGHAPDTFADMGILVFGSKTMVECPADTCGHKPILQ